MEISDKFKLVLKTINYNFKIVFAGYFVYFLIAAVLFYLTVIGIMLFSGASPDDGDIYNTLLFPGILTIFYPVIFAVQHDKDTRMLEIVFGIPNYRYKVYLVRFAITILLLIFVLSGMTIVAYFSVVKIQIAKMVIQLIYPLLFISTLAFLMATLIKNGNGAAVVMVVIGLIFWFLSEPLSSSKWNLFLNPFHIPNQMNSIIWESIIKQNRLILCIGALIAMLWGMINLQQREKFV
ncbi:MAG: hypothetical protein U0W24_22675 [Bacteroidales bacterium]